MPYKKSQDARDRKNAKRRALARLKAGTRVGERCLFNPGPFRTVVAEIPVPPPPPPLSWIDRAQVEAYGYAGDLKPRGI